MRQRKHRPTQQRRANYYFQCYRKNSLARGFGDNGHFGGRSGVQLQYPGQVRDGLHAAQRQNHANKSHPIGLGTQVGS